MALECDEFLLALIIRIVLAVDECVLFCCYGHSKHMLCCAVRSAYVCGKRTEKIAIDYKHPGGT